MVYVYVRSVASQWVKWQLPRDFHSSGPPSGRTGLQFYPYYNCVPIITTAATTVVWLGVEAILVESFSKWTTSSRSFTPIIIPLHLYIHILVFWSPALSLYHSSQLLVIFFYMFICFTSQLLYYLFYCIFTFLTTHNHISAIVLLFLVIYFHQRTEMCEYEHLKRLNRYIISNCTQPSALLRADRCFSSYQQCERGSSWLF